MIFAIVVLPFLPERGPSIIAKGGHSRTRPGTHEADLVVPAEVQAVHVALERELDGHAYAI